MIYAFIKEAKAELERILRTYPDISPPAQAEFTVLVEYLAGAILFDPPRMPSRQPLRTDESAVGAYIRAMDGDL